MNNARPIVSFLLVLVLSFSLIGCTGNQLVNSLDTAVAAAEIALPIVGAAAGLNPVITAQLDDYLSAVNMAADKSVTILNDKSLTSEERALAVSAAFADAIAQSELIRNLPAGVPKEVIQVMTAVIDAVNHFLVNLKTTQAQVAASNSPYASAFIGHSSGNLKLDSKKLASIQKRARASLAKLHSVAK